MFFIETFLCRKTEEKTAKTKRRKRLDMDKPPQPHSNSEESKLAPLKKSLCANRETKQYDIILEEQSIIKSKHKQYSSPTRDIRHNPQISTKKNKQGQEKNSSDYEYQSSQGIIATSEVAKTTQNVSTSPSKQRPNSAKKSLNQESTNYSVKSMSTDTNTKTRSVISGHINTVTAQSMSLCSMIEEKNENKEAICESSHQKNSTFNEDVDRVELADYFTVDLLSTIKGTLQND